MSRGRFRPSGTNAARAQKFGGTPEELIDGERLGEIIVSPGPDQPDRLADVAETGHEHHGRFTQMGSRLWKSSSPVMSGSRMSHTSRSGRLPQRTTIASAPVVSQIGR